MANSFFKINDNLIIEFIKGEGFNNIHTNTVLALKIQIILFLKRIIFNSIIFANHKPYKNINKNCVIESLKSLGIQICNIQQNGGNTPLHTITHNGENLYSYYSNSTSSTPYDNFCGGKNNWSQCIEPSVIGSTNHPVCNQKGGGSKTIKRFRLSPTKLMQKSKTKKKKVFNNNIFNSILDNNSKLKFSKKAKEIVNMAIKFFVIKILKEIKKKKKYTHISKNKSINAKLVKNINLI